MTDVDVRVEASRKIAVMSFGGGTLRLGTAIVDAILAKLGEARSQMLPTHPARADNSAATLVAQRIGTHWEVGIDEMAGGTILRIRDPRFGWMNYALQREEAAKLGERMFRQATRAPEKPRRPN